MGTWFIGDVHGCAGELADLVDRLALSSSDALFLTGDLYDKGPDPAGVHRLVQRLSAKVVLGNHDVLVRDHGRARLGGPPRPGKGPSGYVRACLDALEQAGVLEEVVAYCEALPLWLRPRDGALLVHGGFSPQKGPDGTDEVTATNLREWPPRTPGAEKWWRQWRGPETVVFGHDARQGLVIHREKDRLLAVGLDTGCVYGGALTAFRIEDETVVRVPARKAWHPIH